MTVAPRSRWRQRARNSWPAPLLAMLAVGPIDVLVDVGVADDLRAILFAGLPFVAAIAWAAWAIGGRRGTAAAGALSVVAGIFVWQFGWAIDNTAAAISADQVGRGLVDTSLYLLGLAILLWPLVVAAAVLTAGLARWKSWPVWPALGGCVLGLVVLATPTSAAWGDGCNSGGGAVPWVVSPATEVLMDNGVGVMPSRTSTAMFCANVGDRSWKPFWLGDDRLPGLAPLGVTGWPTAGAAVRWSVEGTADRGRALVVRPIEPGGPCSRFTARVQRQRAYVSLQVDEDRRTCTAATLSKSQTRPRLLVELDAPLRGRWVTGPRKWSRIARRQLRVTPAPRSPDLRGLQWQQARDAARAAGFELRPSRALARRGWVVEQLPRPGTPRGSSTAIRVRLDR